MCIDGGRVGRHLDCACDYGNEEEVGEAIQKAIADGLCTREVRTFVCAECLVKGQAWM